MPAYEEKLEARINELENAIRKHRDWRGDDRCWEDDEVLYSALSEGYAPLARDTEVELDNCRRFIACRKNPSTTYVSPQRRIEELEKDCSLWQQQAEVMEKDRDRMEEVLGQEREKADQLRVEVQGHQKAYDLLLAGMASQAELMDQLKQETRAQKVEINRLRERAQQLEYIEMFGESPIGGEA